MTIKQIVERRVYIKRAVLYRIYRIPGVWRLLGEKRIPKVKSAKGSMVPFEEAAAEALEIYAAEKDEGAKQAIHQDMIRAWYKNTVSPEEYYIFGFQDLKQTQRDTFVSRKEKDQKMVLHVGLGEDYLLLKDKYKFYCHFQEFFHRDVCRLTDSEADRNGFISFCKAHSAYIAKNNKGRMGIGTAVRQQDGTEASIASEIAYLLSHGKEWVIEELIDQDERMALLNPSSLNTVRICSRWNSEGFSVFEAFVRMGRAGSVIDNVSSGGLAAAIDIKTGIVSSKGFGKGVEMYARHPDTDAALLGFQIPDWDQLMQEVEKIHSLISYYPYVGWDFALSKNGWVVIEGNWGNFLTQYLKIGMRKEFEKCFK